MLSFESDYTEGAHPLILQKLQETNMVQTPGYGTDEFCASASEKIRNACGCEDAMIFFLSGGTQTNQIIIDSLLKPYEGVVSAETGHINTHEAGAIEFTGHKVLSLPNHLGKMDAGELDAYLNTFFSDGNHEHMVFPGMVYISHPTEYGTVYSRCELQAISSVCRKYELPLYLDGARMGYALCAENADVTLKDIAANCDVFYIGGTKVGALFGEAVVYSGKYRPDHIVTRIKQHGGLLAKGRILGIQFDVLFTDGLYTEISAHAIRMASILKQALKDKGYRFFLESPTNQQFVILENSFMKKLQEEVRFSFWEKYDENHTVVRFATSWATTEENLNRLISLL